MSDFIRNVSIGEPTDPDYIHRQIKVDSDHVDMATYDEQTTAADSLTKKIHDLEEATPDVATASTAGIVKPGNGLKMAETPAGQDPDGTLELDAGTLTIYASDGTTVVDTYDGSEDVDITLPTNVPTDHSSKNTTYGIGDSSKYGHVKITDVYNAAPAAPAGTALSATGGNALYNAVKNGNVHELTQAEYDALGDVVKTDGKVYYIKDAPNLGGIFMFQTKQDMEDAIEAGIVYDGAACFVVEDEPYHVEADDVEYDNTHSEYSVSNVQAAIDANYDAIQIANMVIETLDKRLMNTEFTNITNDFNSGTFSSHLSDYKPGNFILKSYGGNTYAAVLAHYNYYYNPGRNDYANTNQEHWVAIVMGFTAGQMNTTHTTANGFTGSAMNTWLKGDCTTAVRGAFGDAHLIAHQCLLTTGTYNATAALNYGFSWAWEAGHYTMLMTTSQMMGNKGMSFSYFDDAEANRQFKIFQDKSFMEVLGRNYGQSNAGVFNSRHCWLRDIGAGSPSTLFCFAGNDGRADYVGAAAPLGRFPIIIIK